MGTLKILKKSDIRYQIPEIRSQIFLTTKDTKDIHEEREGLVAAWT